jgi:hypothetical protein
MTNLIMSSLVFLGICAVAAIALLPIYVAIKFAQSKGKKKLLKK